MFPTEDAVSRFAADMIADTTIFAPAGPCKVELVQAPFTPGLDTSSLTVTPATFTGSTPIAAGVPPHQLFQDPFTGDWFLQFKEPLGGWHWVTGDAVGLPQTIYGWVLLDAAGAACYGSELFATPIVLTAGGQGIDIPQVRYRLPAVPLT